MKTINPVDTIQLDFVSSQFAVKVALMREQNLNGVAHIIFQRFTFYQ